MSLKMKLSTVLFALAMIVGPNLASAQTNHGDGIRAIVRWLNLKPICVELTSPKNSESKSVTMWLPGRVADQMVDAGIACALDASIAGPVLSDCSCVPDSYSYNVRLAYVYNDGFASEYAFQVYDADVADVFANFDAGYSEIEIEVVPGPLATATTALASYQPNFGPSVYIYGNATVNVDGVTMLYNQGSTSGFSQLVGTGLASDGCVAYGQGDNVGGFPVLFTIVCSDTYNSDYVDITLTLSK